MRPAQLDELMARMSLAEKIGQMTQVEVDGLAEGAVAELSIGSVLSGGGRYPTPNDPATWAQMVRTVQTEALESRLGIPLLYGVDAVHGHSNVRGATIFPHNVGLGATRDSALVERVASVTANELLATNIRWTFAPAMSVPQDIRWGRTYEAYGQDPGLVSSLGSAFIRGLRNGESGLLDGARHSVLATPKHFVGDGGTTWGSPAGYSWIPGRWQSALPGRWRIDQGDTRVDESVLRVLHLAPYRSAIAAGALSIMVSYSSWNGLKLHAHRYLLTDVLKGELGFDGFVLSDWLGVSQLSPDFEESVCLAINAGVDMVMVPFEYVHFIRAVGVGVEAGRILLARIDDACRRILSVKSRLGLFDNPFGDESLLEEIGSGAHRAVAREAVAKSQVLLKNDRGALPLSPRLNKILVAGQAADDIGIQCGGWTIEWQGATGNTTAGTTLLQAVINSVSPATSVLYRPGGDLSGEEPADAGIVVVGEQPYAEGEGDRDDLSLSANDVALVNRVRRLCNRLILVIYSGRPLIIGDVMEACDAIVASWLPGTEAQGIVDVLFGAHPFTGRLPFAWPRDMTQVSSPDGSLPIFPFGHGLTTNPNKSMT